MSWLTGRNFFLKDLIARTPVDGIYPFNDLPVRQREGEPRVVGWFPDLQHRFYPDFFSRRQWWMREIRLRILLMNVSRLVVSSDDVKKHFAELYRIRLSVAFHVLHFASRVSVENDTIDDVRNHYRLPESYFIVSNQFHRHKNHPAVIRALALLKEANCRPNVVFTGKVKNSGNEAYVSEFYALIESHGLEQQVFVLDVIPREHQLVIMKHARAVIQPSLFEGWSTVVEDAISLGVPVLASSLPVNQEQLGPEGYYFDPARPEDLADLVKRFMTENLTMRYEPIEERVRRFARSFIAIFDK
jgi:glycosyltransferase involved in cell wall biosynthesis